MNKSDLEKIIKEEILEAVAYNTLDKILDALIKGKITKVQAKKYIKDINKNTSTSTPSRYNQDVDCGGSLSYRSAMRDKARQDNFSCGSSNDVRGC